MEITTEAVASWGMIAGILIVATLKGVRWLVPGVKWEDRFHEESRARQEAQMRLHEIQQDWQAAEEQLEGCKKEQAYIRQTLRDAEEKTYNLHLELEIMRIRSDETHQGEG